MIRKSNLRVLCIGGYDAMYHSARASLLRETGAAPLKHNRVVEQFGGLVRDRGDSNRAVGRLLRKVKDYWMTSDYSDDVALDLEQVREARDAETKFRAQCAELFGFDPD